MWVTVDLYDHDTGDEHFDEGPVDDKINLLAISGEMKKEGDRYKVPFCDGSFGYLSEDDHTKVASALKTMHDHEQDEARGRGGDSAEDSAGA
jgi:hypothetical protein